MGEEAAQGANQFVCQQKRENRVAERMLLLFSLSSYKLGWVQDDFGSGLNDVGHQTECI